MPNEAPQSSIDEYAQISNPNRRIHAAMVTELDTQIGRVIDALEKQQMLDNTLILFASDNGGLIGDSPEAASAIRKMGKLGTSFLIGLCLLAYSKNLQSSPLTVAVTTVFCGAQKQAP